LGTEKRQIIMTTILRVFTHEHNAIAVAAQEYQMAKEHVREVCLLRDPTNPDHQKRFLDAMDRQEAARERYVELLTGEP
jgi:hypothetical protein